MLNHWGAEPSGSDSLVNCVANFLLGSRELTNTPLDGLLDSVPGAEGYRRYGTRADRFYEQGTRGQNADWRLHDLRRKHLSAVEDSGGRVGTTYSRC